MIQNNLKTREERFALFFSVWAEMQGWNIPPFHFRIIKFLANHNNWENDRAVLQVFRGGSKSTILGLFIAFMLTEDPTLRFLILSADHRTAKRITADCISIIHRHPMASHLAKISDDEVASNEWQKDRFYVTGSTDARNPSVAAHGIMSNVTSARADIAIFDDVEVPKNCRTETLREQLRQRIAEVQHIMVPKSGRMLFVGTPHAYESIYPETIQGGCTSLTLPLLSDTKGEFPAIEGKSRWPDRFDQKEVLKRQKSSKSRADFMSQYQLIPMAIEDSVLDPSELKVYSEEIAFRCGNGSWSAFLNGEKLASVASFWDVSLSKARGDDSVFAIVFIGESGNIYIHRTIELSGDVYEQSDQVIAAAEEFNVPIITVETNGVGGFVPQILLSRCRGKGIGIDGRYTTKNKALKIIESYETPLSGGFLYVHESVYQGKFVIQMRDFSPRNMNQHDDYIDAPASALDEQPVRIGRNGPIMKGSIVPWRSSGSQVEAKVEYFKL